MIRRGYVDTAQGQMHYRETGEGKPLILVHQALRSSLEYRLVTPFLSDKWRVISIDMMGCGDSDLAPKPLSVPEHAACIWELVDHLGLGNVAIAGHHTGGNVVLEFAANYPEKTDALITSGPAVVLTDEEMKGLVTKMSAIQYPTPKADGSHLLPIWNEGLSSSFDVPRIPATEVELLHDFFLELIKIGPRRKEFHVAAFSHDIIASSKRVKAPTLIISGKTDMWACRRGPELHAAMPNSELREFDTEGEMPRLMPKVWATAVREFLTTYT